MEKEKLVFERKEDYKGYNLKAWYLKEPHAGDALVEIFKEGKIIRTFTFPAYKIYNIQAHFNDIVHTEIRNSIPPLLRNPKHQDGYRMASWTGFN